MPAPPLESLPAIVSAVRIPLESLVMIVQASPAPTGSIVQLAPSADRTRACRFAPRASLLAVMLTAAAAQFTSPLPFTAVPFTLTPLAVMLTGAALGLAPRVPDARRCTWPRAPPALPCSRRPSRCRPAPARLVGPTGGYLLAYPVAAFVTGWLAERGWDRRYLTSLASMLHRSRRDLRRRRVVALAAAGPDAPARRSPAASCRTSRWTS